MGISISGMPKRLITSAMPVWRFVRSVAVALDASSRTSGFGMAADVSATSQCSVSMLYSTCHITAHGSSHLNNRCFQSIFPLHVYSIAILVIFSHWYI